MIKMIFPVFWWGGMATICRSSRARDRSRSTVVIRVTVVTMLDPQPTEPPGNSSISFLEQVINFSLTQQTQRFGKIYFCLCLSTLLSGLI